MFTKTEQRVTLEALRRYHRAKTAEGKLTSQKQKNGDDIKRAYEPYALLLTHVDSAITKLTEEMKRA